MNSGCGAAYIFSGATGTLLYTLTSPLPESGGKFGIRVRGIGDVDNDGYDDVMVGVDKEDSGTSPNSAGRAYVFTSLFSPPNGHLVRHLISPDEEEEGYFGDFIAPIGDANGDGYGDVVVGAHYEDPGGSPLQAGRAHFYSPVTISATLVQGDVRIEWLPCTGPSAFWIYGADNDPYFIPGLFTPYVHRLVLLPRRIHELGFFLWRR